SSSIDVLITHLSSRQSKKSIPAGNKRASTFASHAGTAGALVAEAYDLLVSPLDVVGGDDHDIAFDRLAEAMFDGGDFVRNDLDFFFVHAGLHRAALHQGCRLADLAPAPVVIFFDDQTIKGCAGYLAHRQYVQVAAVAGRSNHADS